MVTPVLLDRSARAKAVTGFDKSAFTIDWKHREVRCPAGRTSSHWNIEGTINQALDIAGTRRARYRGLPEVRPRHAFSATAVSIARLDARWTDPPLRGPRTSRLERLGYRLTA